MYDSKIMEFEVKLSGKSVNYLGISFHELVLNPSLPVMFQRCIQNHSVGASVFLFHLHLLFFEHTEEVNDSSLH